jgi:hypothetical protein
MKAFLVYTTFNQIHLDGQYSGILEKLAKTQK